MKRIYIYFTIILTVLLTSCGEEENPQTIPYAPCNFSINLSSTDNHLNNLTNIGIYIPSKDKFSYDKLISGISSAKTYSTPRLDVEYYGYSGVLIINHPTFGLRAFDLCCPIHAQPGIRIVPTNNLTAKCQKCSSTYSLETGRPLSGSALDNKLNIQSYRVILNEGNKYRVIN